MPSTEVILIRHGETEWNVQQRFQGHYDSELTEKGKRQVEALGERFKEEEMDLIYSSDLPRARKTAEAIAHLNGFSIRYDLRLREKNLGIFEGLDVNEIKARYPEAFKAFKNGGAQHRIEQGESNLLLLDRARNFLDHIHCKHEGWKIAIVTHGGFIRVVIKHSLGISQDTPTQFMIKNTSVHRLIWKNERWMVSLLGDVSHLKGFD